MKKIILSIIALLFCLGVNAQVKEGAGGYATISAVSLVSGTTYNFTITGFNSNVRPRGQDSYTTLDLSVGCAIWSTDCNKFVIASISANTGITMVGTMTSIDAAQAPPTNGSKIAVFREITTNNFTTYSLPPAADGNGASLFGIPIGMRACIDAHYRRQDSIAFANVSGGGTADTSYYKIVTRDDVNRVFVKGVEKGLGITNKGDTAQVLNYNFPTLDFQTGSVTDSDLLPMYDGTNHVKIRADSLKSYTRVQANSIDSVYLKTGGVSANNLSQNAIDSITSLYSPTAFSAISDTITAHGLTANESVTNYSYTSINDLYSKFATVSSFTSSTDRGGWLANGATGDSIAVSTPFGVLIGDSQAEGHPSLHGRLHPNGVATFDPLYQDVSGQLSFHLRNLTKHKWINHGIGGQTTTEVLARFDRDVLAQTISVGDGRGTKTLQRKPFIAVIIAGINDPYNDIPTSTTISNLTSMAQKCAANGIYCVMLNLPGNEGITELRAKQVDTINLWLASGGLNDYGVVVVDYNSWWRDPLYNDNGHASSLIADDVHPSMIGYDSLSTYIFNKANLPILKKVYVYNEIAPTDAITGFSRPTTIRVDTTTLYTISAAKDSFSITTPLIRDSVWFAIVASTNVSGTTYSGFSHIRYLLENNTKTSRRQKYFSVPNTATEWQTEWQLVGNTLKPISAVDLSLTGTYSSGPNGFGLEVSQTNNTALTNKYGIALFPMQGTGTITNNYGFFYGSQAQGTNRYPIYVADQPSGSFATTNNYFGSNVIIGGNTVNMYLGKSAYNEYPEINYNAKFTGTAYSYVYNITDVSSRILFGATGLDFYTASSGSANSAVSFVKNMSIHVNGNTGIGTGVPNASAQLDVNSTTRGFLPPRMTGTQRDAISSPANGLMIYNTTTDKLQVRAAGAWVDLH